MPGTDVGRSNVGFSFFIDAELPAPTRRNQISLGLSLEIKATAEGIWIASGDIGWQFVQRSGDLPATDWDFKECETLEIAVAAEFFEAVPSHFVKALSQYEAAVHEYVAMKGSTGSVR